MKKANKILSIILAILMVISIIPITASADEPTSGICGDNLTWEFDEYTSTLTISGTGEMYRYNCYFNASNDDIDDRPWRSYTSKIKNIVINEGVTTISKKAFYNFRYLFFVTIPSSVTRIEDEAFYSWDGIMAINYLGSEGEWNNINIGYDNADLYNCDKFYFKDDYIPVSGSGASGDNLTWIFDATTFTLTFSGTGDMEGFQGDGGIFSEPNFFDGCRPWEDYEFEVKHIVISEGITSIGKNAFAMFINLESVEIPRSITQIGSYSFGYCINLTDVYYSGTENEWNNIIKGDIFPGLNLVGNSYNVPLDNATIHYNYTPPFTGIKDDYFYKDDVKQKAYQLVEFQGDFYFINDYSKIAKNKRIYLSERFVNGFTYADGTPLKVGYYEFDENGKMIIHNGVVGDYFYKNNERIKAYQLVEFDGDFYFINDAHKVAKNKTIYLSDRFVNGFTYEDGTPLKAGYYTFDENGKMVMLNGPVGDYFYENNIKLKAYQLVEFEGNYYFINNSNKLAKNTRLYMSQRFVEGTDLKVGYYNFDADGKLIKE